MCYNRAKAPLQSQTGRNEIMTKKKALLVYPEFATSFWSFKYTLQYLGKKSSMPSLGLLTLAGMFPKDYHLRLVDMNVRALTDEDLHWADLVCASTMIVQRKSLADVIARAKNAGKPIVVGGPHPTSYWEEIQDVDYFLLGEVEETFRPFLRDLEIGIARHIYIPKERPSIVQTPPPRYSLINMHVYGSMLLQFSRGCPFDCEFCDITKLYGRVPRTKTNEQMLTEFQLLYDLGWRGSLFLVDDNFIGNRRDALRFLKALIPWQAERNFPFDLYTEASMNVVEHEELMDAMVQAGFTSVFVGIETPTAAALVTTKKKQNVSKEDPEYPLHAVQTLHAKGLQVMAGFILGLDGDAPDAFDLHIKFIQQAGIPMAMEGLLTVLKETDLYFRMEREGRLAGDTTGNHIGTHLNYIPEMPEYVLTAGYLRVLNAIYDRCMEYYFERCWTLLQRLDRSRAPKTMSTPLGIMGIARFMWKTAKQLASTQGPAYIKFLGRVMLYRQSMFREALGLAAKGYHLRKITEQITAVDSLQHYLTHVIASLQNQLTRAHSEERKVQMKAHARYAIARALNEYLAIHRDFRDGVVDALAKFDADLRDIFSEANLPRLTS
jgi:radical SAM superfamily enzyme YgiQ (UPF0313 family)